MSVGLRAYLDRALALIRKERREHARYTTGQGQAICAACSEISDVPWPCAFEREAAAILDQPAPPACALCGRSDITLRQTGPDTWVCADDHLWQWRPAEPDLVLDERYAAEGGE